mgnify:CR=1 FL=1
MNRLFLVALLSLPVLADVPGVELLRDGAREGAEEDLGVASLEDLPQYTIDQAIDDVSGTFSARMTLRWTNLTGAAVSELPLQLHPNAAKELGTDDSSTMTISEVSSTEGPAATFEATRPSLVTVTFASPIAPGARTTLSVRYGGKLRKLPANANDVFAQAMSGLASMSGAGVADYGLVGVGDGLLTMASAYPMAAPFREGSFDTGAPAKIGDIAYNGQAVFVVRTIVPAGMQVVTNLVDGEPEAAGEKTEVVVSQGALVRDLLLVAGRDLAESSKRIGDVRVRSVYRAKDEKAGKAVLEVAADALTTFEKEFGPYPYTELDIAEASLVGGAGGVEFPAMVLIAGMLYRDPGESTSQMAMVLKMLEGLSGGLDGLLDEGGEGKKASKSPTEGMLDSALEFTVAHEVAHEYFAITVGNDCHRYPFVDEPLAQYLAGLAYADRHGAAEAKAAMDMNVKLNYALYRMLDGKDKPVAREAAAYQSTTEYAALVYGKAPYLYVALAEKYGEDRFHQAIREGVRRHRFQLVTLDGWAETIGEGCGDPEGVRGLFRRWMEEKHGDKDLGVSDDGEFVMDAMFGPETAASLKETLPMLGMKPKDFLKGMFGGGLGDDLGGEGIDPEKALKELEDLLNGK